MLNYTKKQLEIAVKNSESISQTLIYMGFTSQGGNHKTIKKYIQQWDIDTSHFLTQSERIKKYTYKSVPLEELLVRNSSASRSNLKKRLYASKLKTPICEICGQNENWHGKRMSMILDHINGIRDDNRLENLRIVCPNCNATLDTHCGKRKTYNTLHQINIDGSDVLVTKWYKNLCDVCKHPTNRKFCSRKCYSSTRKNVPKPSTRKVKRPTYKQLSEDIKAMSMLAVGRKYGVSDNAVRKWLKFYEQQKIG